MQDQLLGDSVSSSRVTSPSNERFRRHLQNIMHLEPILNRKQQSPFRVSPHSFTTSFVQSA